MDIDKHTNLRQQTVVAADRNVYFLWEAVRLKTGQSYYTNEWLEVDTKIRGRGNNQLKTEIVCKYT